MQEETVFGNVLLLGQTSVQDHPKVLSGVFRYELSAHKGEAWSEQSRRHLPTAKDRTFSLAWVQQ